MFFPFLLRHLTAPSSINPNRSGSVLNLGEMPANPRPSRARLDLHRSTDALNVSFQNDLRQRILHQPVHAISANQLRVPSTSRLSHSSSFQNRDDFNGRFLRINNLSTQHYQQGSSPVDRGGIGFYNNPDSNSSPGMQPPVLRRNGGRQHSPFSRYSVPASGNLRDPVRNRLYIDITSSHSPSSEGRVAIPSNSPRRFSFIGMDETTIDDFGPNAENSTARQMPMQNRNRPGIHFSPTLRYQPRNLNGVGSSRSRLYIRDFPLAPVGTNSDRQSMPIGPHAEDSANEDNNNNHGDNDNRCATTTPVEESTVPPNRANHFEDWRVSITVFIFFNRVIS